MKTRRGYLPKDEIYPLIGLNTLDPSPQADQRTSPNCQNVLFTKGIVQKRSGYGYLGDAISGTVLGLVEFETLSGTKYLLCLTTTKQYKLQYDGGTGVYTWDNLTYKPSGSDVNWTGDESDTLDYAVVTGFDSGTLKKWIIITNGKDQPRYWDGSMSRFGLYAPTGISGVSTTWTCKTLISFYDHLILANLTDSSSNKTRTTLYWSKYQNLTDFATGAAYDSGVAVLTDTSGEILKIERLADRAYIYSQDAIHAMVYVGGALTYTFEKTLEASRLLHKKSAVNVGPYHLFMSQENVSYFDGTRMPREVGDRISRSLRDELYSSKAYFAFAFHDAAKRQVYFSYPTGVDSAAMYHLEYTSNDSLGGRWTKLKFANRITAMGFYSRNIDLAYDSTQFSGVPYYGSSMSYAQGSIKGGFPVRVMGGSGRAYIADDTTQNDITTAIDSWWDSIDFTVPEAYQSEYGRWIELELEMKGFEADVYYSTDKGETYTFVERVDLDSGWEKYKINIDVMSKTFRVRIRNNCASSTFSLRWLRVWVQPGGPA